MRTSMRTTMAIVMMMALAATATAKEKASATLHLETKQVSAGIGWSWGSGTITFKGAKHRFKIDGLSVNSVGATASEATGYVYGLKSLADFAGTYSAVAAGGTAGGGKGIATMKNSKGVRITLHSTSQGLNVTAGPEGMKITLE